MENTTEVVSEGTKSNSDSGSRVARFPIGSLVPINGVWFKISKVDEVGLTLEPVGFTKKGRKPS